MHHIKPEKTALTLASWMWSVADCKWLCLRFKACVHMLIWFKKSGEENSFWVKQLTMRSVDYLQEPGRSFWKRDAAADFSNIYVYIYICIFFFSELWALTPELAAILIHHVRQKADSLWARGEGGGVKVCTTSLKQVMLPPRPVQLWIRSHLLCPGVFYERLHPVRGHWAALFISRSRLSSGLLSLSISRPRSVCSQSDPRRWPLALGSARREFFRFTVWN